MVFLKGELFKSYIIYNINKAPVIVGIAITKPYLIKEKKDNFTYSKWYSLEIVLENNKTPTYHFRGSDSIWDQIQLREIKTANNIYLIPIQSTSHGGDFHGFFYPFLLNYNDKKIQKMRSKNH